MEPEPDYEIIATTTNKKRHILFFVIPVLILLMISLGFFVFLKYNSKSKSDILQTDISQQEGVAKYDIQSLPVETPWNKDLDTTANFYKPTINELNDVYANYLKSIYTRDYDLFANSVSARTKWIIDINAASTNFNKDGTTVSTIGEPRGKDYFKSSSPERFRAQIPFDIKYFQPQKLEDSSYVPDPDYILEDPKNEKITIIRDIATTVAKKLYYNINFKFIDQGVDHISYDYDGYVFFVFENGKWVYRASDWQTQFDKNKTISLDDLDTKPEINRVVGNSVTNINIKVGDIIVWKDITGIILSTDTDSDLSPWNSPLLLGNSFEKQFITKGKINYQIGNITKDEIIKGIINVE